MVGIWRMGKAAVLALTVPCSMGFSLFLLRAAGPAAFRDATRHATWSVTCWGLRNAYDPSWKALTERHHGNICECYGLWQTLCGWPGMAVAVGCRFEWGSSLQQPSGTSQASSERGTCDLLFTGTSASI